mmetsp:Transcript_20057/g.55043  ORF Transcript_20057/g.55043 Transcript_20057/m.55043 type:complete len:372 (-) Transcript_20057:56-1171(-)
MCTRAQNSAPSTSCVALCACDAAAKRSCMPTCLGVVRRARTQSSGVCAACRISFDEERPSHAASTSIIARSAAVAAAASASDSSASEGSLSAAADGAPSNPAPSPTSAHAYTAAASEAPSVSSSESPSSSAEAAERIAAEAYVGGAPRGGKSAGPPASMTSTAAGWLSGAPVLAIHRRRIASSPPEVCRIDGERNCATPFGSAPPKRAGARHVRCPPDPPVGSGKGKPKAKSKKTSSGSRPALASLMSSSFLREPATLDWRELRAKGTASQNAGCNAKPSLAEKRSARSTRSGSSRRTFIHQIVCSSCSQRIVGGLELAGETGIALSSAALGSGPTGADGASRMRRFRASSISSSERKTLARTSATSVPIG